MRCTRCRHENPPLARFCSECGLALVPKCASCGVELPPGAKFCVQCGQPGGESGTGSPLSPRTYTPKHLVEKILSSRDALDGERKRVTVLFADMKGSMELLAERDPEDARGLLDPVLKLMMQAVHLYEGTVNQVMGDGIMALFGAPVAHEDHAVRACYAALKMQESVKAHAEAVRREHGVTVQIRVGINSGEVVVREISSDLRMDYTAVGQTTHLAARMEQLADAGAILIAPDTLALVEGYVAVRPLGPIPVKGVKQPINVHELTGAGLARTRLQAARARGLSRFIGRDSEMAQLRAAIEEGRNARGQIIAVVGEPGAGKSRLYYEFIHSHDTQGWLVLESRSVSYGKATAYLALATLFRNYFKIETRDDISAVRTKVAEDLLALDESLREAIPPMLSLLDALPEDHAFLSLEPVAQRRAIHDAAKRTLLRQSQVKPLLLVFEDLHWIDSETQVFLDVLIESVPAAHIVVAVNYRPQYQHRWGSKTYYRQLRLDSLPREGADRLIEALLGGDPSVAGLKALLTERTEGNPLFIEESVRMLFESGALVGVPGGYRLVGACEAITVPATVQSIIAARIDQLDAADKELLQAAAVVGMHVPLALLQIVSGISDDELQSSVARLQEAEFIRETRLFPELEFSFKHALTHDVAYEGVLYERRKTLHRQIVATIERLYAERLVEHLELLAHHAVRGAVWDKALRYLHEAAGKAAVRSANREALALLDQALEIAAKLPETVETLSQILDVQLKRGPALIQLKGGHDPEAERCYASAEELCKKLHDESRLFPAIWGQWAAAFYSGRCRPAEQLGERLLIIGRASTDSTRLLEGHHCLWSSFLQSARLVEGCSHADEGIKLYDRAVHHTAGLLYGGHDPGACARFASSWMLWDRGYPDRALRRALDAERLAHELAHVNTIAAATSFATYLYYLRGDSELAFEKTLALEDIAKMHSLAPYIGFGSLMRACLANSSERTTESVANAAASLSSMRGFRYATAAAALAELLGEIGELSKGLEVLDRAITIAERDGMSLHLSEFHRLRGELLVKQSDAARIHAISDVQRALQIARRQDARSLELRALMTLARLHTDREKREEMREQIRKTYGWFTEGFDTRDLRAAALEFNSPAASL